ncbi:glycosyltransferase [Lysobacter sp. A286]
MSRIQDDVPLIEASGLLDNDWYLRRYPDVSRLGISAAEHYLRLGAALLRDPGPLFSTRHYVQANPDVVNAGTNPLVHYLVAGKDEGRTSVSAEQPVSAVQTDNNVRDVSILRSSPLFDARYYLDNYPDVRKHGMDPLLHYVKHGAREGRQPNPWFSTRLYRATCQPADDSTNPLIHYLHNPDNATLATSAHFDGGFYSSRYDDVVRSGITPLEHYLEKGVLEGRQTLYATPAHAPVARIVDCRRIRTTVVVPVYNASAEAQACIRSILRHTPLGAANHLLIIDDASTDPGIREVLQEFASLPGICVVRNSSNLGYTRTVNKGCELAEGNDVVLLNSDTVVGPHWLRNLKVAAYRSDGTGTVTAVSNNAGAFSVPRAGSNDLPKGLDVEAVARVIAACRFREPFEVPTGNGFCMYIKRALIDDIGVFDADSFPIGYGEENEFCMRALMAGWCHRVDPGTYVGHIRSASFGERRRPLAEAGMQRVQQMYPEYAGAVRGMGMSRNFEIARYRIARKLEWWMQNGRKPKPRIMYVISIRVGGTPQTNADLMHAVADDYDCFALWCDRNVIEVLQADGTGYKTLQRYPLTEPVRFATHVSGEYDDIVRSILVDWGIDLLHIRHLAWHSLNLVDVARSLDIPVIHSFHDFYTICPSVTLIGEDGSYQPTGVTQHVRNPLWRNDPTASGLTGDWLDHWQQRMQQTLSDCATFVTTCQSAKDILVQALPSLAARAPDIHVIPHGRDFEQFAQLADNTSIEDGEPLRILLPGNIGLQKGMELVKQIKNLDVENKLEFHLLGKGGPGLAEYVVDHGSYQRHQFAERVARIKPHIGAILSIWPETYCHTLTECWSCGIPVIGIDLGAVGERIGRHKGGWLVDAPANADTLFYRLLDIRSSRSGWREAAEAVMDWQLGEGRKNTTARMAEAYVALYRSIAGAAPHKSLTL